jgi:DHA1 family bicyclomycin/chloramphenicol resistance-like MFS transporter
MTPGAAAAAVRAPSIFVLAAMTAIGPLGIHIVVPAVPVLATDFGVGYAAAQLVVTVYLFAIGFGQLFIGPVSDAVGRRPVLIVGIGIYVVGSAVCALAWSIDVMVATRFIQGVGGCTGIVLGRAIIRDVYSRERTASAIAYVSVIMVLATMSAAPLGGFLADSIGWRGTFAILTGLGGAVLVVMVASVRETKIADRVPLRVGSLLATFGTLLRYRAFTAYAITCASIAATFFCFVSGGPYVIVNLLGHSPTEFGFAFMFIAFSFVTGTYISGRYAQRVGTDRLITLGCIGTFAGCLAFVGVVAFDVLNIWTMCAASGFLSVFGGLVLANATANFVSVRPDLAGTAAGLGGFIQFGIGSFSTVAVGLTATGSALPLALLMLGFSVLTAVSFVAARGAMPSGT